MKNNLQKNNVDKNMNYTEIYNLEKIKFLFNLPFKTFDEYFNLERNIETCEKYSLQDKKNYHKQIIRYLNELLVNIENDKVCSVNKKYKITSFRCYVRGFGLQSLQKEVRDFLLHDENCYDFDIVNAIPSILLYFAEINNISTPQLRIYVEQRQNTLNEYGLTKNDIIINLNQDNPKTKNKFMNLLNDDFMKIKNFIKNNPNYNKYNSSENSNNPLSSKLSKILYEYETKIIQKVVNILPNNSVNALTFDGFIYTGENPNEILENINLIVSEYKYVKFIIKKFEPYSNVLDEFENFVDSGAECNHYSTKKIEFEKKFNYCTNFGVYLEKVDGDWVDRSIEQFKMNCAPITHTEIINGVAKKIDTFSVWKKDPNRLVFDNIVFEPYNIYDIKQKEAFEKKYENKRVINKFKGFKAKKIELTTENLEKSKIFWDYLYESISYNDEEIFNHLKNFFAHIVQRPQELAEVINVFKSLEGAGKDTLINILSKILGEEYIYSTADQSEIFGSFNEVLENKLILVFNEAEGKAGLANKEKIKDASTKKKNTIKKKYQNATVLDNYVRIFFFSNNANPVSLSADSRRFCIIKNNYIQIGNKDYFSNLNKIMDDETVINTIFTELLEIDLSNYTPRFNKPITNEEVKMKLHSYNILHYYLFNIKDNLEDHGFNKYKTDYYIASSDLQNNFINYLKDEGHDKKFIKNYKNFKRISNELLNDKLEGISFKNIKINSKSKKMYFINMKEFLPKINTVFRNHKIEEISNEDLEFEEFIKNQSFTSNNEICEIESSDYSSSDSD